MQIPGKVPHGYRPSLSAPTARPQHLCRSERETCGGVCVDGPLTCAASCPATLFHSAARTILLEAVEAKQPTGKVLLMDSSASLGFQSRRNAGVAAGA